MTGGSARGLQEGKPGREVMGGSPSCSQKQIMINRTNSICEREHQYQH